MAKLLGVPTAEDQSSSPSTHRKRPTTVYTPGPWDLTPQISAGIYTRGHTSYTDTRRKPHN